MRCNSLLVALGRGGRFFSYPLSYSCPGAKGFEARSASMTEERKGLPTSEPASEAAPVFAIEWTVRRELWIGNMLRWENILRLRNRQRAAKEETKKANVRQSSNSTQH